MKKVGSVNPCNLMFLYDKNDNQLGTCLDTPNNFAIACILNKNVHYGVAYYPLFGTNKKYRSGVSEIIKSYETLRTKYKHINDEIEKHKEHINFL